MLIKEVKTYKLNELPGETRQKVINNFRYDDYFHQGDEIVSDLKQLCKIFNFTLKNYRFGDRGETVSIEFNNENIENLEGVRLWKYININYSDELKETEENLEYWLHKPIASFMEKPTKYTTFQDLIEEIEHFCIKIYNDKLEYWYKDETIIEEIEANEYDFTEQGKIF